MSVDRVDIICDRGIWHARNGSNERRASILARFVPEEDPKAQDVPGWRLVLKEPRGGTPGAIARATHDRSQAPKLFGCIGIDEHGEIKEGLIPEVQVFPCMCGWPTFAMPEVADLAKLLDRARSRGERTIHVDDLNRLAPNGAFLAFYQPAPLSEWETFARLSSTKSRVPVEPPYDSECFALKDRDGRWLQVVCDGGPNGSPWHHRHGARVIAALQGDWADEYGAHYGISGGKREGYDEEAETPYVMLDQVNMGGWGVEDWETTYALHPCSCGREFPTMKRERFHRVIEALAARHCYCISVDTFMRAVALS
ncbi:hypothetical protein [Schaalia hyovaginalis]|uniref:Uncharacterized protein n=1 Tax=Schaalia hyovaginalis TaxID=29316 RepID=A0A923E5I3_9ACTO|nr:hypothetical protein [Schaalia hyovaginalis]MBB6335192.1 hypothetical protein [Schaalia hyovaginalis]